MPVSLDKPSHRPPRPLHRIQAEAPNQTVQDSEAHDNTLLTILSAPQAYNSIFNADPNVPRLIGNFPLLPLRTKTRGPAYTLPFPNPPLPSNESPDPESDSYDVLDEVLSLFRANTFFRNFEIQGPADRLLIYGILFLSECLSKIRPSADMRTATKDVMNLALDTNFAVPGDPAFPLNQVRHSRDDRDRVPVGGGGAGRGTCRWLDLGFLVSG